MIQMNLFTKERDTHRTQTAVTKENEGKRDKVGVWD